jgi:hypothetical protein
MHRSFNAGNTGQCDIGSSTQESCKFARLRSLDRRLAKRLIGRNGLGDRCASGGNQSLIPERHRTQDRDQRATDWNSQGRSMHLCG